SSSVLPDPAGASTMNDRAISKAAKRASRSRSVPRSFMAGPCVFDTAHGLDPAHRLQAAILAGQRCCARRDRGVTLRDLGGERAKMRFPPRLERAPIAVASERCDGIQPGPGVRIGDETRRCDGTGTKLRVRDR